MLTNELYYSNEVAETKTIIKKYGELQAYKQEFK